MNTVRSAKAFVLFLLFLLFAPTTVYAQTASGELENRAAPVARRKCIAGANAGSLCNENADCPGSSCVDRNIFNISVAVHFNAIPAEIATIENMITAGSAMLFDVTDGQAQIGEAVIHNNAFGTTRADVRIYPSTQPTWWTTDTGSWKTGGSIHVSINNVATATAVGESFAHEFVHLVFDARDEYEQRPGCGNSTISGDSCPIQATINAGQAASLMDAGGTGHDGDFSELCWGQGNAAQPTNLAAGIHDAHSSTEQSQCRSNRSVWDQVVWTWPNTFRMPGGAPDPAANGLTATAPHFLVIDNTTRGVLVLDESGSMGLESPSRMERLKVAANDFVALAESGAELGVVSYASDANPASGRKRVSITAIGANRTAFSNAIDSMSPSTRTNIGSGLQVAHDLINTAGGVTGNTFVVLMTDGLNNEPGSAANAAAELQAKINDLQAAGIEVYVTCTGSDLGLESQCSEIATGTGGFYVDSARSSDLPESFVHIGAYTSGHELIAAQSPSRRQMGTAPSHFFKSEESQKLARRFLSAIPAQPDHNTHVYFVEDGSESALFTVQWKDRGMEKRAIAISPSGQRFDMMPMPQGLFRRISKPEPGNWSIQIVAGTGSGNDYVAKAYSRNRSIHVQGGVRYAQVRPGERIYVYAYPRARNQALTHHKDGLPMLVTRPDGTFDMVLLHDRGRDKFGDGDDVPGDGVFTGVYQDTQMKGAYQFASLWDVDGWPDAPDTRPRRAKPNARPFRSPKFARELSLTATVADPHMIERTPDDPPRKCSSTATGRDCPCGDQVESSSSIGGKTSSERAESPSRIRQSNSPLF